MGVTFSAHFQKENHPLNFHFLILFLESNIVVLDDSHLRIILIRGCGGSSLSRNVQTSLSPATNHLLQRTIISPGSNPGT